MSVKNFIIDGGKLLSGEIKVGGSKNETLAILACVLALKKKIVLKNVPKIIDVFNFLELGKNIGLDYRFGDEDLYINAENITKGNLDLAIIKKLRASIYYLPILVGLNSDFIFGIPGGCNLGGRPIDYHLNLLSLCGVTYIKEEDKYHFFVNELHGFNINLPFPSFGTTINAMLLSIVIKKKIIINGYAKEPEIIHVISFLKSFGIAIEEKEEELSIDGTICNKLVDSYEIHPDRIVAASYISLGALVGNNLVIDNCPFDDLKDYFSFLDFGDIKYSYDKNQVSISAQDYNEKVSLVARPYPGFSTDIVPLTVPLLASGKGIGFIKDRVYKKRLNYLEELTKFNANIRILEGDAIIFGSDNLLSAEVVATDLRGGMASLLLALKVKGKSKIRNAEILLRGYENILSILKSIGANIYEEE